MTVFALPSFLFTTPVCGKLTCSFLHEKEKKSH
ncbi:hypothetical protein H206_05275 [Candidatus Electrothrix aarhusensis]|uniref:Uncharacterized protein n=1 Tax=Candidatus Electrothrix aarhusensis TaxID=1859131 RepID=A0A3S3R1Y4_9BACT|nr:hypothetical protein H206_05275 [Candidatus Electrothrix aarhusensis]